MTTDKRLEKALIALLFYADPDTYFGIGMMADRPCGEFADDFSDDHGSDIYDRPMPGKLARSTLKELTEIKK